MLTSLSQFRYIGSPDFHDGRVQRVAQMEKTVAVILVGSSGTQYHLEFSGVASADINSPEGMLLYALAESESDTPLLHRYKFVNWYADGSENEKSRSRLELVAESFTLADYPLAKC